MAADGFSGDAAPIRTATGDHARAGAGITGPSGSASRWDTGDALCMVGVRAWGATESVDDESDAADAGIDAQKKTLIAREQDPQQRALWREQMETIPAERLLFLDETSTPTDLTPLRGRASRGTRVVGRVPRGRWTQVTLLATLSLSGLGPAVQFAGALDRPTFEQYVESTLVPQLQPGQMVVLDNLSVHKSARARQLIEAAGCQVVFLPTYSPDFNPIEQAFAKLKHLLRKTEPRSVDDVMTATHRHYPQITSQDAAGYFRNAGYDL